MMTLRAVEELIDAGPKRDSVEYRNAWSTVEARLARTSDPEKLTALQALYGRLTAFGEPEVRKPMSQAEALQRAREANEARAIGRARAALAAKLEAAHFGRCTVVDTKPYLFEAALQLVEDGEATFLSSVTETPVNGPEPEGGRVPVRRVWLGQKHMQSGWQMPWKSKRQQAEEARI